MRIILSQIQQWFKHARLFAATATEQMYMWKQDLPYTEPNIPHSHPPRWGEQALRMSPIFFLLEVE
jgi:hypothetical protein